VGPPYTPSTNEGLRPARLGRVRERVSPRAMDDWGWAQRWRYGVVQALGFGLLVGAFETVSLVARLDLPLGWGEALIVGVVDAVLMGGVAVVAGAALGVLHLAMPSARPSRAIAWQLAGVAGLLCAVYLWPEALLRFAAGERVGAAAMAILPLGFVGVTHFNARYWLARVELGRPVAVSWLQASGSAAAVIVLGCSVAWGLRDPGGGFALDGDRNVLVVTIDGLGIDQYGESTPALEGLARDGVRFTNAVTPAPGSGPANATVLTGLHPLRHRVLFDGDSLLLGLPTLTDVLAREGYATGGFVSARTVRSALGYSQGFGTFDDDFSPVAGVAHIGVVARLVDALGALDSAPAFLDRRAPSRTADRFQAWNRSVQAETWFAWVHLAGASLEADSALGAVLDHLDSTGQRDRTLVVVAGTFGRSVTSGLPGLLADEAIRVPLVIRAPGDVSGAEVAVQVRLMDVSATALDFVELDAIGASEGVPLLPYARGERQGTMWTALVGGDSNHVWFGMRNNGLKYVEQGDLYGLWNVVDDPDEQHDLSAYQVDTLNSARQLLLSERVALDRLLEAR
jgi:hypothetical protein